jgi:IS4 transposase
MLFREVLDRFVKESPVSVMVRATLEHTLTAEFLDQLFRDHAVRQRESPLLFSTIVDLMTRVVCGVRPSLHAAYQAQPEEIGVAVKSVYNKVNGVETQVSQQLVRQTAQRMLAIVRDLQVEFPALVPGYRTRILDGNHLAATEHRLKELRVVGGGPLPGQALVTLDGDMRMVLDVFPCEDAYTSERLLLLELVETIQAGELWIADRNFCTPLFVWEVAARAACFLVREHATNLNWDAAGPRRYIGRSNKGAVYEQPVRLLDGHGSSLTARRITIVLDEPTADGDRELHLLTNLPPAVDALTAATAYRGRWRIEGAFGELEAVLASEIDTLSYPAAALFAFCLSLVAYNLLRVVRAALARVHGVETVEKQVSSYYLAVELGATWRGLLIAVPPEFWESEYGSLSTPDLAARLKILASGVKLSQFRKHVRGPKKPPPRRTPTQNHPHVSTARIIAQRKLRRA